ncbi:MAG: dienelactone hydrolase family protein [Xanthobacteraceae bacterium]
MSTIRSFRLFEITALLVALLCAGLPCRAQFPSVPPAEQIEISLSPLPFDLRGFLRRPEGTGRFPAVVLLPACGQYTQPLDEDWGARISSWGYVALTIDGFSPRGITHCGQGISEYPDLSLDAYRGLNFLASKKFVDAKRIAVVGFAWGAVQTISAVEHGEIERASEHKFRAAAAFFPLCASLKGNMTVPTLILIGERDDLPAAEACRKMAAGEDDMGISRQKGQGAPVRLAVYPDAYFAFDLPVLKSPTWYLGRHVEFNKSAADRSSEALREFFRDTVEGK